MSGDPDLDDLTRRMSGALDNLKQEFGGLRTGRASTALVEPVSVEVYGSVMPLNQVGTVTVPEPRLLSIQVWDKANIPAVEKAIRNSGLGLNPVTDGQNVRIPIPELTQERRVELGKVANKYAEQARIAIRNVRRSGMDELKKSEKDGHMSEDDQHMWSDEVQKITDDKIKDVDELLHNKEKEIMQV
jgi:ribosome recycling factor